MTGHRIDHITDRPAHAKAHYAHRLACNGCFPEHGATMQELQITSNTRSQIILKRLQKLKELRAVSTSGGRLPPTSALVATELSYGCYMYESLSIRTALWGTSKQISMVKKDYLCNSLPLPLAYSPFNITGGGRHLHSRNRFAPLDVKRVLQVLTTDQQGEEQGKSAKKSHPSRLSIHLSQSHVDPWPPEVPALRPPRRPVTDVS